MSNINNLLIAISLAVEVESLSKANMVGQVFFKSIPEHYVYEGEYVIHNYRVGLYHADGIHLVDVRGVGLFQVM
jgi:hypothetical protein